MKNPYFARQLLLALQQLALIVYIAFMTALGLFIQSGNAVPFFLLSLLFFDAAYISYKNIKNNPILNHFSCLLLLLGWQFLLSLYGNHAGSAAVSVALLPVCLYQTLNFIQAFAFQSSAYQWQKLFLSLLRITCATAAIGFFISPKVFAIAYQLQFLLSLISMGSISLIHHKRIGFMLRSQKKQLLLSAAFVLLPFMCYVAAFHNQSEYMSEMGSYLAVMLVFFSVHSIVFRCHPLEEHFFRLKKPAVLFLLAAGAGGFTLIALLFRMPLTAVFLSVYVAALLAQLYHILLYMQFCRNPGDLDNLADSRNYYSFSLAQIKREEALKEEFSNYLHDNILQDLLSVKNLLGKVQQAGIQTLIYETIGGLTSSLRLKMQSYHPTLLRSLTLKENIQNLLDTLTRNQTTDVILDCSDTIFLVEPYNVLICRMIQELVTNALKHAGAAKIRVLLIQENDVITLKVSDNGAGFDCHAYEHTAHRGLDSIQEQAGLLNGNMTIQSAPGNGTRVTVTIPMKGEASYENFISR